MSDIRDAEAAGSNPVIPIQYFQGFADLQILIFLFDRKFLSNKKRSAMDATDAQKYYAS